MVDRDDDEKIGIKSTAILFGGLDIYIVASLELMVVVLLVIVGIVAQLGIVFFSSLVLVLALFGFQVYLTRNRNSEACFKAFKNNTVVGLVIFLGVALSFALKNSL